MVGAVYHIPSGPHPDYPAVDVLEGMLTVQPAGRLYKALVEAQSGSIAVESQIERGSVITVTLPGAAQK